MRISDWSSDVCSSDLARGLEAPRRTAEHQRAELEAGVDVGEEDFLVLEVEQGTEPPRGGNAAEERRRPLVGGDPRRRQQADDAIGPRQVRGAFDEQAVDVDVAGRQQRVRSEEHTSELQSLMRNSYAVFCLKKKKRNS